MNNQKELPSTEKQEITGKRKNFGYAAAGTGHDFNLHPIPKSRSRSVHVDEGKDDLLELSLSCDPPQPPQSPPPPQPFFSPQPELYFSSTLPIPTPPPPPPLTIFRADSSLLSYSVADPSTRTNSRQRPNSSQTPREGKNDTIPIPYPWATDHRATIHSRNYLESNQITKISGKVGCKKCERHYEIEFDLFEKFMEVANFIYENKDSIRDRAPGVWMNPRLPTCKYCDSENSVKPIISDKKRSINWLFLLLGQMLGCCTLKQLKYFCKHTKNHRTGAKNRVLYLTYLCLCKQLDPTGPFDR